MLKEAVKKYKLGDVFRTTSGGTPSRKIASYYNGSIPWVKSGELESNTITDTEEKITEEAIKNSSAKLFPKGTLLIALYGATIGKLAKLGIDAATNQAVCGIFENEENDLQYLYWYLQFKRRELIQAGTGGAQPNISQTILKNLEVPLPKKNTQRQIVSKIEEVFSELDQSIEQLKITQQQLKVYRQSVLKCAFEGTLTNKNAVGKELQKRWTKKSLKDLKRFSLYGPRFSSIDYSDDGVAILRTSDIDERGKVDWIKTPKLRLTDAEYEKYKLIKGDLLITRTGSIGTISVFNDDKKAIPGAFLIHYRLVDDVDPQFIFYFLKTKEAQDHFKSYSFGVGRPNLNVPNIELLLIPIPPLEEQQRVLQEIESRLSIADKIEEAIVASLQQSEALRQGILKKAFEGELWAISYL